MNNISGNGMLATFSQDFLFGSGKWTANRRSQEEELGRRQKRSGRPREISQLSLQDFRHWRAASVERLAPSSKDQIAGHLQFFFLSRRRGCDQVLRLTLSELKSLFSIASGDSACSSRGAFHPRRLLCRII